MGKYLVKRTDIYRIDTETEAKTFMEQQIANSRYEVVKHSTELRQAKAKGEVVDEWYRVTIVKNCNDEKDPIDPYIEEEN